MSDSRFTCRYVLSQAEPQERRVIASRVGATPLELTSSGRSPREDAQEADGQPARAYHRNAVRESRGATNLTRSPADETFPIVFTYRANYTAGRRPGKTTPEKTPFTAGISPTVHGPLGHLARASRRLCRARPCHCRIRFVEDDGRRAPRIHGRDRVVVPVHLLKREVIRPYWGAAILPTTWTPGPLPGVGLSTTVSPWSGRIPISGRTVRA